MDEPYPAARRVCVDLDVCRTPAISLVDLYASDESRHEDIAGRQTPASAAAVLCLASTRDESDGEVRSPRGRAARVASDRNGGSESSRSSASSCALCGNLASRGARFTQTSWRLRLGVERGTDHRRDRAPRCVLLDVREKHLRCFLEKPPGESTLPQGASDRRDRILQERPVLLRHRDHYRHCRDQDVGSASRS